MITFVIFQAKGFFINGSLIIANITGDVSYFQWSEKWVNRYNQSVRLAQQWQYQDAKSLLSPLLNDTSISYRPQIAELYGDLIYSTSGSLSDVVTMYERSLEYKDSTRVKQKIEFIKNLQKLPESTTLSGEEKNTPSTIQTGSTDIENKKKELEQISKQRSEYLSNSNASQSEIRGELQKLIEFAETGNSQQIQDW